jgi:hypothetical protein
LHFAERAALGLALGAACLVAPAREGRGALPAPIQEPLRLTATFGEYRANHFHAGVDLSTGERVGVPVHAPLDGEVVRVRASGVGYGRALYVRARDGRLLVFGHLDRFDSPIAEYVQAIQDSTGDYEQDLEVPAGRLRVRAGQRLAWSGDSGAGPPHLHVEVRHGDTALNPLREGLPAPDTRRPRVTAVVLEPFDPTARVEGAAGALVLPRARARRDTVRAWGRLRVSVQAVDGVDARAARMAPYVAGYALDGAPQVGVAFDSVSWYDAPEVEVQYDFAAAQAGVANRLHLWRGAGTRAPVAHVAAGAADSTGLLVLEPGRTERTGRLTVWVRDVAGLGDTVEIPLRVPPDPDGFELDSLVVGAEGGRHVAWLTLARRTPDDAPVGSRVGVQAWREIASGRRRAARRAPVGVGTPTLEARDALGADRVRERWRFPLTAWPAAVRASARVAAPQELLVRPAAPRGAPTSRVEDLGGGLLRITLAGVRDLQGGPRGELDGLAGELRFASRDGREWTALAQLPCTTAAPLLALRGRNERGPWLLARRLSLARLGPEGARLGDPEGRFAWRLEAGGAYAPRLASFEREGAPAAHGLEPVGPAYAVMPPWLPLRGPAHAALRLPEGERRRGVALYDHDGVAWRFLSADTDSLGRFSGSARRAGYYALMRDTLPPRVGPPHARRREAGPYGWLLRARVTDAGAGLEGRDVWFEVDDRKVPTEYDVESDEMRWRPPAAPAPGTHRVVAVARDRVGNPTRLEARFVIR